MNETKLPQGETIVPLIQMDEKQYDEIINNLLQSNVMFMELLKDNKPSLSTLSNILYQKDTNRGLVDIGDKTVKVIEEAISNSNTLKKSINFKSLEHSGKKIDFIINNSINSITDEIQYHLHLTASTYNYYTLNTPMIYEVAEIKSTNPYVESERIGLRLADAVIVFIMLYSLIVSLMTRKKNKIKK
jgi:hypothetical protein